MPCTNCMAEYSRTRKEHGCSKCAFSFCGKCVSKKFVIPVLSPNPVSVCDNCYNILTGKANGSELGLKKARTGSSSDSVGNNWWGNDRLPPPSMRAQYAAERRKGVAVPSTIPVSKSSTSAGAQGTDWEALEQRLANLTRDLPFTCSSNVASLNDGQEVKKDASLAEIEERLAALKEVPVEVIRNPRLRIYDPDTDDRGDDNVDDDVVRLLAAAEARAKLERRQERCQAAARYNNSALEMDDDDVGASKARKRRSSSSNGSSSLSSSSFDGSPDSSVIRCTVQSALNTPSVRSSDMEDANTFHPDFADCIEQTIKDAKSAERHASEFIRQTQKRENSALAEYNRSNHDAELSQLPAGGSKNGLPIDSDHTDNMAAGSGGSGRASGSFTSASSPSANKVKSFFQRFLK